MRIYDIVEDTLSNDIYLTIAFEPANVSALQTPVTSPSQEYTSLTVYPNPIQNHAVIEYQLKDDNTSVEMKLFNPSGQVVKSILQDQRHGAGQYNLSVDASDLENGMYFLHFVANGKREVVKLVVSK